VLFRQNYRTCFLRQRQKSGWCPALGCIFNNFLSVSPRRSAVLSWRRLW